MLLGKSYEIPHVYLELSEYLNRMHVLLIHPLIFYKSTYEHIHTC